MTGLTSAPTSSLLLLVVVGSTTFGQTDSSNSPAKRAPVTSLNGPTSPGQANKDHEIFSVLIPIDEAGEVAGAYAYAPTRLLELLAGGEANSRSETPRILSADYTLRMQRSLLGQLDRLQEVSVEFRLQVTQADVELRLPFNSNQLLLQRGNAAGRQDQRGNKMQGAPPSSRPNEPPPPHHPPPAAAGRRPGFPNGGDAEHEECLAATKPEVNGGGPVLNE